MTADVVELRDVSRWYGNVVAVNGVSFSLGPRRHRAAGPQRRRQVDASPHDRGPAASVRGVGDRGRARDVRRPGGLSAGRARARARGRLRLPDGPGVRAPQRRSSGRRRAGGRGRARARDSRAHGCRRPRARHVLEGDAPAGQGGRGARPRPGSAGPRRAVQRHGSPAAAPHDGPAPGRSPAAAPRSWSRRTSSRRWSASPSASSSWWPGGWPPPASFARSAAS